MSYRHHVSPLNSTTFEDVEPFSVSAAFQTIHRHLRLGDAHAAETSINYLRLAADYYINATRTNHGR